MSALSAEELLGRVGELLGRVAGLGLLAAGLVLGGVLLGVPDHAVDVLLGSAEPPVIVIDCSLPVPLSLAETCTMPLASMSKVTSICGTPRGAGAMPVSSNVPSGLLSRANSRSPWKTWMGTRRLVVVGGGEDLGALGRDGRVALDELGHHAALGLDAEGERGDVDEQDVLALALEDTGLQAGADGDDLVRVDALVGLLAAGQLLDEVGDGRHAGGAADEHDVVDVGDA